MTPKKEEAAIFICIKPPRVVRLILRLFYKG